LPLSVFLSENTVVNSDVITSYSNSSVVPAFKIKITLFGAQQQILSELKGFKRSFACLTTRFI
jgi:hypothetical protein